MPKRRHPIQLDFFKHLKKDGSPKKPTGPKPLLTIEQYLENQRANSRRYHARQKAGLVIPGKPKWKTRHRSKRTKRQKSLVQKLRNYRAKEWLTENPDRVEKYNKSSAERMAKSRIANPEKHREAHRRNYQKNKPTFMALSTARKKHIKKATPPWVSKRDLRKFYKMSESMTKQTGIKHEVDHIVPLRNRIVCGLNAPINLRIITKDENYKKRNTFIEAIAIAPTIANGLLSK